MTSPVFVSFTDMSGATAYVSTQADIACVITYTAAMGKPGSVADASLIVFGGSSTLAVEGTVATTYAALGVGMTGPGVLPNTPQGTVALASYGTDAVSTADTWYWSEGYIPTRRLVSTIACLNGTTVGTDNVRYAMWDSNGAVLGSTAAAGALSAVSDVFQGIAVSTPFYAEAGRCWVGFNTNGTTCAHQTIAASTYPNWTGTTAATMEDAVPAITPTTSTTAGVGPFWRLS
jgi:hypothetical protein